MQLGGRYEIIEILGQGGFAITYKAIDIQKPSQPICVVKELLPQHNNTFRMDLFEKEARILETLGTHSQIPHLLAYFQENDKFYIVQQFIQGQCLNKEICRGKQHSEGYVIKLLEDVLEVLAFVHEQKVIHRDIKPHNLIRRQEDAKVCLIDFGIVKEIASHVFKSNGSIKTSVMAGTFGYMPAEQVRGKTVFASDIYALGVTAIQALTGLRSQDIEEDPETAELVWQNSVQVSETLAMFLKKMVRRHHSLRYENAMVALAEMKNLISSLPTAIASNAFIYTPIRDLYYQEAAGLAQKGNGIFSSVILKRLEKKRVNLGLSRQESEQINQLVLQPYQQSYNLKQQASQVFHPENYGSKTVNKIGINGQKYESQGVISSDNTLPSQSQNGSILKTKTVTFETAKLVTKPSFLGLMKVWEIEKEKKIAEYFTEEINNGINLEIIAIPSGSFLMGLNKKERENMDRSTPQHPVLIKPFLVGKYPVTQAEWQAVCSLPKVKIDLNPNPSYFQGAKRPVEQVSWYEAQEFCARLSQKTGRLYRLPSESEWEYACRAGTITPFYCGNTITTDLANYNGEYVYGYGSKGIYRKETTDVGIFPPNPFGLYDTHGNVWEWCQDGWYDNYIGAPNDGSAWLNEGDNHPRRVLRGGSWSYRPVYCRSAYRMNYPAISRDQNHGFRVACSAQWDG